MKQFALASDTRNYGQIAIDPPGTNVYIDSGPYGRYTVSSIDASSGSMQGSFAVQSPFITLSRDGSMLYVADPNGIVSLKTPLLTKAGFFAQPGRATGFSLAADRPIGAAVNSSTATLCYIDPQSGKVTRTLPIGPLAQLPGSGQGSTNAFVATTTDGKRTFVLGEAAQNVTIVDNVDEKISKYRPLLASSAAFVATNSSSGPLYTLTESLFTQQPNRLCALQADSPARCQQVADFAFAGMTVSPDGSHIWIWTSATQGTVYVYDAATFTLAGSFTTPSPLALAFSPDGKHAYIGSYAVPANIIDVDTSSLQINRSLALPSPLVESIQVSPDGATLYVLANQSMLAIDVASWSVRRHTPVGQFAYRNPSLTAMSPDGSIIYIADNGFASDDLLIYHTADGTLDAPIPFPSWILGLSFTTY